MKFKLKYKAQNEAPEIFYFDTIQEVLTEMLKICEASSFVECLKVQKEYNIRFYVTKINK